MPTYVPNLSTAQLTEEERPQEGGKGLQQELALRSDALVKQMKEEAAWGSC